MEKHLFELSVSLAKAEFKLRNEGSKLGILWYLLNPILLFLLLYLVFFDRLGNEIPFYPAYLFLGILMFNFFLSVTSESCGIILKNSMYIKSIKFPKEALVLSVIIKNLFSHAFEIIIFVVVLLIFGIPLNGLLFYPFIFLWLCVFVYGISLFLAALTMYFIDLGNIWGFFSRLLWFATPIFNGDII